MATTTLPAPSAPSKDDPTMWRVDDVLWARLAPLLTIDKPRKKPGRPRRDDRVLFEGLIWILRSGAPWAAFPPEFGPTSTCPACFQEWGQADVVAQAWALLLQEYDDEMGLDWAWQAAEGGLVKAPLGKRGRPGRPKRPGQERHQAASADRGAGCAHRAPHLRGQPHRHEEAGRAA